jgi:hypothetical protein
MSGAAFLSATKSASLISGVSSFVTRIEDTRQEVNVDKRGLFTSAGEI